MTLLFRGLERSICGHQTPGWNVSPSPQAATRIR